jgi:hypothetical protein
VAVTSTYPQPKTNLTMEAVKSDMELINPDTGKKGHRYLDPAECRKKYRWLRNLGMDSYQADKMKTWPWPWIQDYIRRHGQLGNPDVRQQRRNKYGASTLGKGKCKPGGLAESSEYQEGLYQSDLMGQGQQKLALPHEAEASVKS